MGQQGDTPWGYERVWLRRWSDGAEVWLISISHAGKSMRSKKRLIEIDQYDEYTDNYCVIKIIQLLFFWDKENTINSV